MTRFIDSTHEHLHDVANQAYDAAWKAHQVADQAWRDYIEYGKLHSDDNVTPTRADGDTGANANA